MQASSLKIQSFSPFFTKSICSGMKWRPQAFLNHLRRQSRLLLSLVMVEIGQFTKQAEENWWQSIVGCGTKSIKALRKKICFHFIYDSSGT
jgi:hypothetical protein